MALGRAWAQPRESPAQLSLLQCSWQDQAQHPAAGRDNQVKQLQLSPSQHIWAMDKENIDNYNDICAPATRQAQHLLLAKMIANESLEHPGWCASVRDTWNARDEYSQLVSPDVNLWSPLLEAFHLCGNWGQTEIKIPAINGNICEGKRGETSCQVTVAAAWLSSKISTRYYTFSKLMLFHTDKTHAVPPVTPPPSPARAL